MSDLISRFEEGMMWKSPIEVMQKELTLKIEGEIMKAVQEAGVHVDKEELLKALQYDREQYEKGYDDGFNANKWIPVEERLPEEEWEIYITTHEDGNVRFHSFSHKDGFVFNWNINKPRSEVIAWMPLPEPYRKE